MSRKGGHTGPLLRVAFITGGLSYGGGKRLMLNVLQGLSPDQFSLSLITVSSDGPMKKHIPSHVKHISLLDSKYARNAHAKGKLHLFCKSIKATIKVVDAFRGDPPHILLSDTLKGHIIAYFALRLTRRDIIWIARKGIPIRRQYDNYRRNFKEVLVNLIYKFLYRRSTHIITPSIPVKTDVCEVFDLSADNVSVIPNPIDIRMVQKKSKSPFTTGIENLDNYVSNDNPFILFVGRLIKRKQVDMLIDSMAFIKASRNESRLFIIGDGPELPRLREKVNKHGLEDSVFFLGASDNPFYFMQKARVFAFPAVREGFGYVIVEAMLCRCPVVALDIRGGPSEIISHMETGYLVPYPHTAESLAYGILKILNDPALSDKMRDEAEKSARQYNLESISNCYGQKLQEIFAESLRNKVAP